MSSKPPVSPQAKRLAALIAAHDEREGNRVTSERFHQGHIEELELSGAELDYLSDRLENAADVKPGEEYKEKMLLARFFADAAGTKNAHFMFVIARCIESITVISNHNTGSYSDYPVINVMDIYKANITPKAKWGPRLDASVYDRMSSILVALYLERVVSLDGSCMLRVDMYREVIEPLVANEGIIRPNLRALFKLISTAEDKSRDHNGFLRKKVVMDVHGIIRLARMLEAHKTNLDRVLFLVRERGAIDLDGMEECLLTVPALTGGGL